MFNFDSGVDDKISSILDVFVFTDDCCGEFGFDGYNLFGTGNVFKKGGKLSFCDVDAKSGSIMCSKRNVERDPSVEGNINNDSPLFVIAPAIPVGYEYSSFSSIGVVALKPS